MYIVIICKCLLFMSYWSILILTILSLWIYCQRSPYFCNNVSTGVTTWWLLCSLNAGNNPFIWHIQCCKLIQSKSSVQFCQMHKWLSWIEMLKATKLFIEYNANILSTDSVPDFVLGSYWAKILKKDKKEKVPEKSLVRVWQLCTIHHGWWMKPG